MLLHRFSLAFALTVGLGGAASASPMAVDLGNAARFAVLSGAAVTNTGSSVIDGDVGVWPGTSVTGFGPGLIVNGGAHAGDVVAMLAQSDALAAFTDAAGRTAGQSLTGLDLGGMTLTPGVYSFSSSAQLTGTLTLNTEKLSEAVFIFQIGSTLTTASNSMISFINGTGINGAGAQVFWEVGSSATLGTGTVFDGDIVALTSVTLNTGATIGCGAAIALNGAVTLDSNSISNGGGSCAAADTGVPEPGTYLLVLAGCAVLAAMRRRGEGRIFLF